MLGWTEGRGMWKSSPAVGGLRILDADWGPPPHCGRKLGTRWKRTVVSERERDGVK